MTETRQRPVAPSGARIAEYWSERQTPWGKDVIYDSPKCFACGYFRPDERASAWKTWEKACKKGLEKAHIIPHSLGGSNDVSNFVLLCFRCHDLSPDCGTPEPLFEWMSACPGSFFDIHWEQVTDYKALANRLTAKHEPAHIDRWNALCQGRRMQLMDVSVERLGGVTQHFSEGFTRGTQMAMFAKSMDLVAANDLAVIEIETADCEETCCKEPQE